MRVLGRIHIRKWEGLRSAKLAGIKLTAALGVRRHAGTGLRCAKGPTSGYFGLLEGPGARLGARTRAVRALPTAAMRFGGGELRSSWRQRLQHGREQGRKGKRCGGSQRTCRDGQWAQGRPRWRDWTGDVRRRCAVTMGQWRHCGSSELMCFVLEEHRVISELVGMEEG